MRRALALLVALAGCEKEKTPAPAPAPPPPTIDASVARVAADATAVALADAAPKPADASVTALVTTRNKELLEKLSKDPDLDKKLGRALARLKDKGPGPGRGAGAGFGPGKGSTRGTARPVVTVAIETPDVKARRVLFSRRGALLACYERLSTKPTPAALTATIAVAGDGRVKRAKLTGSKRTRLRDCVERQLVKLRFPPKTGEVVAEIRFKPRG